MGLCETLSGQVCKQTLPWCKGEGVEALLQGFQINPFVHAQTKHQAVCQQGKRFQFTDILVCGMVLLAPILPFLEIVTVCPAFARML